MHLAGNESWLQLRRTPTLGRRLLLARPELFRASVGKSTSESGRRKISFRSGESELLDIPYFFVRFVYAVQWISTR